MADSLTVSYQKDGLLVAVTHEATGDESVEDMLMDGVTVPTLTRKVRAAVYAELTYADGRAWANSNASAEERAIRYGDGLEDLPF